MREWELIDAQSRWAGALLVDGELVRRTARMLGDWNLQSTLLRNAVLAAAALFIVVDGPGESLSALRSRVRGPAGDELI